MKFLLWLLLARLLKFVSQSDVFKMSATRNILYVFKKFVYLIVFVKDIFDIYLNNILLSFYHTLLMFR